MPADPTRMAHSVRFGVFDAPALSPDQAGGELRGGRELGFNFVAAITLVGLVGILLMAGMLYISFHGKSSFSTTFGALRVTRAATRAKPHKGRTDRYRPVAHRHSDTALIEAAVKTTAGGVAHIEKRPFRRIETSLATVATRLTADVPAYDAVSILEADAPPEITDAKAGPNPELYGLKAQGALSVTRKPLHLADTPKPVLSDADAAEFALAMLSSEHADLATVSTRAAALAYIPTATENSAPARREPKMVVGAAENLTVLTKTAPAADRRLRTTERVITVREPEPLATELTLNGFTGAMVAAVREAIHNIYPKPVLPAGAHLRVLYGPGEGESAIPYRLSIYAGSKHAVTVALTDKGRYVIALPPPPIPFTDDDTEPININALPTLYRAIWETGRQHKLPDPMIERIVAMFAFDTDMTQTVDPGDAIDLLETAPKDGGPPQLLYVKLDLGAAAYQRYRFRTEDGRTDFYGPDGSTGKRFLIRRPLKGGGRVSSAFGWRMHPILHRRILHAGVDLAAPYGTPIYAAGDGVVVRDGWVSGYGRLVELAHANGYSTRYAHMSRFASGLHAGAHVRQGQVIGYIGTSGRSTGPHVHFEIRINGKPVNPLSVRLPRARSLPPQDRQAFARLMDGIGRLMKPAEQTPNVRPIAVAAAIDTGRS